MRKNWSLKLSRTRDIFSVQLSLSRIKKPQQENLAFPEKIEVCFVFRRSFERRVFHLKLNQALNSVVAGKSFTTSVKNNAKEQQQGPFLIKRLKTQKKRVPNLIRVISKIKIILRKLKHKV